jgi:hypothetical protein
VARQRAEQPAPLRFRGPPTGLQTFASGALTEGVEVSVTLKVPGPTPSIEPLPVDVAPVAEGAAHLRLSLPPATPPGTYEGTMRAGDAAVPVSVEVESFPSLRLAPAQLNLEIQGGGQAEAHVTALNDGNVPVDIPSALAFGLFDVVGAERGIRAAFGTTEQGNDRVAALADELAASHGGLTRVQVADGAGELGPGEVRALLLRFRLSESVEPSRTYSGTLALYTLRYYVRVAVLPAADGATTRRRRAG